MSGRIPQNVIEDILNRIDIAQVISSYIPLKRAGRNFKALCPFHNEKTPSFIVSADKQIYHCFGCGTGGSVFNFLMQYERLEFSEAVELLAKKSGVILPSDLKRDHKTEAVITQLYRIHELAASFYEHQLNSPAGLAARKYLLERQIKPETLKLFKLGYAFDVRDGLLNYLRAKDVNLSLLEKAGVVLPREGGGYYDRFRNRIIFPVWDIKGRIIAFGGRLMPVLEKIANTEGLAKYVNSPQTPIYIKGRNLYGLHLAKEAIREADLAIVVEGYLDFMTPYQEGIENIVASQGTSLTYEQVRLLKRYARNVVIVYDADTAGQSATLRALDIFVEEEMGVRMACLPEGFDPDLFVRKRGVAAFKTKISEAEGLFDYKLKLLKRRWNIKEAEGKAAVASEMLLTINKLKNAILKAEYIKALAEELVIPEDSLLQELQRTKDERIYSGLLNNTAQGKMTLKINPTEKLLLKLMLEEKGLIVYLKERIAPTDFQNEQTAKVVSLLFDLCQQGKKIEPSLLVNYFDSDTAQLISEATLLPEISQQQKEKIIADCIQRLKLNTARLRRQELHKEIKKAQDSGDREKLQSLTREFDCLIKRG